MAFSNFWTLNRFQTELIYFVSFRSYIKKLHHCSISARKRRRWTGRSRRLCSKSWTISTRPLSKRSTRRKETSIKRQTSVRKQFSKRRALHKLKNRHAQPKIKQVVIQSSNISAPTEGTSTVIKKWPVGQRLNRLSEAALLRALRKKTNSS